MSGEGAGRGEVREGEKPPVSFRHMYNLSTVCICDPFWKNCLYVRISFFLIYLEKLIITAYLSYGASFDTSLAVVLTI